MSSPLGRIACARGDLVREAVDAIVNAANSRLSGGGGVDGAIHRAAGPGLLEECARRYPEGCPTGEVRITGGHALPARYVIHAVGPIYRDGRHGEAGLLAACYRRALELAARERLRSIAFPALSCGAYRFPWAEAAGVALEAIAQGLQEHREIAQVRMVLFNEELFEVFREEVERRRRCERGSDTK